MVTIFSFDHITDENREHVRRLKRDKVTQWLCVWHWEVKSYGQTKTFLFFIFFLNIFIYSLLQNTYITKLAIYTEHNIKSTYTLLNYEFIIGTNKMLFYITHLRYCTY